MYTFENKLSYFVCNGASQSMLESNWSLTGKQHKVIQGQLSCRHVGHILVKNFFSPYLTNKLHELQISSQTLPIIIFIIIQLPHCLATFFLCLSLQIPLQISYFIKLIESGYVLVVINADCHIIVVIMRFFTSSGFYICLVYFLSNRIPSIGNPCYLVFF